MATLSHIVKRGDGYTLSDRVTFDATGHTVVWTARPRPGASPVMTLPVTVSDAGGGASTFTADLTLTETQAPGHWLYEYECDPGGAGELTTVPTEGYGRLEIQSDLSLAEGDIPLGPGQELLIDGGTP